MHTKLLRFSFYVFIIAVFCFIVSICPADNMPDKTINMSEPNSINIGNWFCKKDKDSPLIGAPPVIRIECGVHKAVIKSLGWDTEGGNRAKHNIIKSPVILKLLVDGNWLSSENMDATVSINGNNSVCYELKVCDGYKLIWELNTSNNGGMAMRLASENIRTKPEKILMVFDFNQRLASTSILSENWTDDGQAGLPAIISVPDIGQMHVACPDRSDVKAVVQGHRGLPWSKIVDPNSGEMTVTFQLPVPDSNGYVIKFEPLILPQSKAVKDTKRWLQARRGWFNLLQFSASRYQSWDDPNVPKIKVPAGLWANNTLSDPVSSTVHIFADHALLIPSLADDISVMPMLRRTVEYWINQKVEPNGNISYLVISGPGFEPKMMDTNPSVIIGAWAYVKGTDDLAWCKDNIARLEYLAAYIKKRDIDGDGIIESEQSGNRGSKVLGDTAWDTYCSGHKNAYVNILCYRAFRSLADLEKQLGRIKESEKYNARADRIKLKFYPTFYNPETGWLGLWRSQDGCLHDIWSDLPTSMAVAYGIIDGKSARRMTNNLWSALKKTGFNRFDIGIPLNMRPVHRDDQFGESGGKKEDGSDTFGKYLNGGCCVYNTYYFLTASLMTNANNRYNKVMKAMLYRQEKGVFPNGGGFQNGFVDKLPFGAEFYDWQGTPCGYEGHLIYSWAFLQTLFFQDSQIRDRLFADK